MSYYSGFALDRYSRAPELPKTSRRTVFTNDMVAHVWASQSQASGRNGKGSFYFEGATIYSYRVGFPIATFVKNKRGESAVLFTRESYSITTSIHKSRTQRAIPSGVPVFNVPHLDDRRHGDNLLGYKARFDEMLLKAAQRRTAHSKEWDIKYAGEIAAEQNAYLKFFGLRNKLLVLPPDVLEKLPEIRRQARKEEKNRGAKQAKARAQREKRYAEQQAREATEVAESLNRWLAGESVPLPQWRFRSGGALLRVKDDQVQTSQGAEVPVEHAKRLWPIIQRVRKSGKAYERNGHTEHVGHFAVDRIDKTGDLHIGCHHIPYPEVERIAGVLGLTGALQ